MFLLLCAYALSATINHVIQTMVAMLLGDKTAEREGWLTFNPVEHIDPIGIIVLLFTNFVWVSRVPFNAAFVKSPFRTAKIALFYLTQPFVSILLAVTTLTLLVIWFGPAALGPAFALFFYSASTISLADFAQLYPTHSSLSILGGLFLMAFVVYNLLIATISIITNTLRLIVVRLQEEGYLQEHMYTNLWFITFLIIFVASAPLYSFLLQTLVRLSFFIGRIV